MCSVIRTKMDLMSACFEKDFKKFKELFAVFQNCNVGRFLVWCVQAGWEKGLCYLLFMKGVSLHPNGENLLCEAIHFNHVSLMKFILRNGNFYNDEYFPQVIEAIHLAEKKCQHEIALYLLNFLLNLTTEGVLENKFGYKITESLKIYSRGKDYIDFTRHVREINYFQPIFV